MSEAIVGEKVFLVAFAYVWAVGVTPVTGAEGDVVPPIEAVGGCTCVAGCAAFLEAWGGRDGCCEIDVIREMSGGKVDRGRMMSNSRVVRARKGLVRESRCQIRVDEGLRGPEDRLVTETHVSVTSVKCPVARRCVQCS